MNDMSHQEPVPARPAVEPLLKVNDTLGRYRIKALIAQGGMGDIYLAVDLTLDRDVALKCLSRKLTIDLHFVERFRREAKATAAVVHTNVVPIHELGEENGLHYFSMEYVPGETLGDLIAREGKLAPAAALPLIRQAALGLAAAAARGLIHRDVKPSNILISPQGVVKLTDFGLVRALEDCSRITHSDMIVGTPHYVSPEQARGDAHIDHRADIYSLGITLYHTLSGTLPFHATTPMGIMLRHVNDPLPPLNAAVPSLPAVVVNLVHRMVEKDPCHRFAGYDELVDAIDAAITVLGKTAPSTDDGAEAKAPPRAKSFDEHFHPTMPLKTAQTDDDARPARPSPASGAARRKTGGEDLDATKKRVLEPLRTPYDDLGGLIGTAWNTYAHSTHAYDVLARGPLRWGPPLVIGAVMALVGYVVAPVAHPTRPDVWQAGYLVFLLTDLIIILPLYAFAKPAECPHGRWLAAAHLVLLSWTAQVWFVAGKAFILAWLTPWIAYRGLKHLLGLEGGRLMAVWLACLILFTLRCAIAFAAAGPVAAALASSF